MNYNKIIDNKFKVLKENKRRGGDFHLVVGYWLLVISKLRKTNNQLQTTNFELPCPFGQWINVSH